MQQAGLRGSGATAEAAGLVERAEPLRRIAAALDRTIAGQGGAVFLSGEAGIGKTRLAHEALALAERRGLSVLQGRAYPLEHGLAYTAIVEAFGEHLRRQPPAERTALVGDLPDLGRLFGDLRLPPVEPLGDPALDRLRLFDAVARLLERVAQRAPTLLFMDDLHWADPATVELLHYLVRPLAQQPVLLLGTFRADEADASRGLRQLRLTLGRAGLAEELDLGRLSEPGVAALARATLGGEPAPEVVALLHARSGGTPLFVEALARALVEGGYLRQVDERWQLAPGTATPGMPRLVHAVIAERLERLDEQARRVAELVAAAGDALPHPVLASAAGVKLVADEDPLGRCLDRLRSAGMLLEQREGPDVAYRLAHPLVQEVVYAELGEAARRRTHAQLARAFAAERPDDLEHLARHCREAGSGLGLDPEWALSVLLAAAQRAADRYAHDDAARHLGAALAVVRGGTRQDLLPRLLERLGDAWEHLGEAAAAATVWAEALEDHVRRGDRLAQARLRYRLANAAWNQGHLEAGQADVEAGLQALADLEPSQERADLLHTQLIFALRRHDLAGATSAAQALLWVAEQLGTPRTLVQAHLGAGATRLLGPDLESGDQEIERARALAEQHGEWLLVVRALDTQSQIAFARGDHRQSEQYARQSLQLGLRLRSPALQIYPRVRLVAAHLLAGEWDAAAREADEAIAVVDRRGLARGTGGSHVARALVRVLRGDVAGAEADLASARAAYTRHAVDRHMDDMFAVAETLIGLEVGDGSRALAAAERLARPPDLSSMSWERVLLAEAQLAAGQPDAARATARVLLSLGHRTRRRSATWRKGWCWERWASPPRRGDVSNRPRLRWSGWRSRSRRPRRAWRALSWRRQTPRARTTRSSRSRGGPWRSSSGWARATSASVRASCYSGWAPRFPRRHRGHRARARRC